jgi:hypothetical protein
LHFRGRNRVLWAATYAWDAEIARFVPNPVRDAETALGEKGRVFWGNMRFFRLYFHASRR